MHVSCELKGDFYILSVEGKLDAQTAPELEKNIDELLPPEATRLIFDLGRVDYVSSAALRVFLLWAKKMRGVRGEMRFAALQPRVIEVFDMAGFTCQFKTGLNVDDVQAM